jgi:dipeptide/tripeptide permease
LAVGAFDLQTISVPVGNWIKPNFLGTVGTVYGWHASFFLRDSFKFPVF